MAIQQNWNNSKLDEYLRYGFWPPQEAWVVLAGLDYLGSKEGGFIALDLGFCKNKDKHEYKVELSKMTANVKLLYDLWISDGREFDKRTPEFFIEWALSKSFPPAWLDWAIEKNLYVPKRAKISATAAAIPGLNPAEELKLKHLCEEGWEITQELNKLEAEKSNMAWRVISGKYEIEKDISDRIARLRQRLRENELQQFPIEEKLNGVEVAAQPETLPVVKAEPEQSEPKTTPSHNADWMQAAKTKADIIYKRDKGFGCDPSNKDIAKAIEKEFENEGVLSDKNKRLTADYILRHGLKGWVRPKK